MQFITSLFGGSENTWLTAAFALGVVIVLIVLGVWLLKLLFKASGRVVRGRNRRLAVVDTLALDPKRQLVIVRRDGVEHLLLTGGPQDVVIETGIPIEEEQAAQPPRRSIPMVSGRKQASPKVVPVAPSATPGAAVEKLREAGKPANEWGPRSLRHTGLLRPVSDQEPTLSPENGETTAAVDGDSAKEEAAQQQVEGTKGGQGGSEASRN